jgi:hypothetical protein
VTALAIPLHDTTAVAQHGPRHLAVRGVSGRA